MFLRKGILTIGMVLMVGVAFAQEKPNILVIWGDDIGVHNVSAYNNGIMGYQTPNIDRTANEGALFTHYYAQNSCTAGRAFVGQADLVVVVDACRHAHAALDCGLDVFPSPTHRAGRRYNLPASLALRARHDIDEESPLAPHLAYTATCRAALRLGARLGSASGAMVAHFWPAEFDFLLDAMHSLFEA